MPEPMSEQNTHGRVACVLPVLELVGQGRDEPAEFGVGHGPVVFANGNVVRAFDDNGAHSRAQDLLAANRRHYTACASR